MYNNKKCGHYVAEIRECNMTDYTEGCSGCSVFVAISNRPDIVVCHACKYKGGDARCNDCVIGDLFEQ